MSTVNVILVRGTAEPFGGTGNMLRRVADQLDPLRFVVTELQYPASVGPANPQNSPYGPSLQHSVAYGIHALLSRLWELRGQRVAVIGYSLGGLVISRVLETWADTLDWPEPDRPQLPEFVGILANPARARQEGLPGYGIHHETSGWPDGPTYLEIANPLDGITCCPDPSPLRTLSDQVDALTLALGGGWTHDLADRLLTGRWQSSAIDLRDPWGSIVRYVIAARLMRGYLDGSQHIKWYADHGITPLVDAIKAVS